MAMFCHSVEDVDKSDLLRLKDLEKWVTRVAVHPLLPNAECALETLDKVTAYELRHHHDQTSCSFIAHRRRVCFGDIK